MLETFAVWTCLFDVIAGHCEKQVEKARTAQQRHFSADTWGLLKNKARAISSEDSGLIFEPTRLVLSRRAKGQEHKTTKNMYHRVSLSLKRGLSCSKEPA